MLGGARALYLGAGKNQQRRARADLNSTPPTCTLFAAEKARNLSARPVPNPPLHPRSQAI